MTTLLWDAHFVCFWKEISGVRRLCASAGAEKSMPAVRHAAPAATNFPYLI